MIANDVCFLQPESIAEAVAAYAQAMAAGKRVHYFAGGTELVTRARERAGEFDVLVDLKHVPECSVLDLQEGILGATVRLSAISDQDEAPLLAAVARGVADRTTRNSVTLAGNICSLLPYRELLLPLLLFNATLRIAGPGSERAVERPLVDLYGKRLQLPSGSFVVAIRVPEAVGRRGFYRRRTRDARIDYPIASVAMDRINGELRLAIGGAYGYPVRAEVAERALNAAAASTAVDASAAGRERAVEAAEAAIAAVPDRLWDDMRGSPEYRRALLRHSIAEGLVELGGR